MFRVHFVLFYGFKFVGNGCRVRYIYRIAGKFGEDFKLAVW